MQEKILGFQVRIITKENELKQVATQLSGSSFIAFDTEFDRFKRKYGFNLELIQLFDGKEVYLIQVSQVENLDSLKLIFESEAIVKIVYSGVEDIEALKTIGINPVNVYDIQLASKLCNQEANSLVGLLADALGVTHTKEKQKSDWSKLTLEAAQIEYAAKDVIYLVDLYEKFLKTSAEIRTNAFIEEENKELLKVEPKDHVPKIKQYQRDMFNYFKLGLLKKLLDYRNEQGKLFNKPPTFVFRTELLDEITADAKDFKSVLDYDNAPRGFFAKFEHTKRFDREIKQIIDEHEVEGRKPAPTNFTKQPIIRLDDEKANPIIEEFVASMAQIYGEHAATYIGSGLKSYFRDVLSQNPNMKYHSYRKVLISRFLESRGIEIESLKLG